MAEPANVRSPEPAPGGRAGPGRTGARWLAGEKSTTVRRPLAEVVELLHDLHGLEEFEPKADRVVVHAQTATSGTYRICGRIGPLPWAGSFSYVLHDRGFDSRGIGFRLGIEVEGGFEATVVGDVVRVRHYERYRLPLAAVPLRPWLARRLRASQTVEMAGVAAYLRGDGLRVDSPALLPA